MITICMLQLLRCLLWCWRRWTFFIVNSIKKVFLVHKNTTDYGDSWIKVVLLSARYHDEQNKREVLSWQHKSYQLQPITLLSQVREREFIKETEASGVVFSRRTEILGNEKKLSWLRGAASSPSSLSSSSRCSSVSELSARVRARLRASVWVALWAKALSRDVFAFFQTNQEWRMS